MSQFISFWSNYGWLSNLLTVVLGTITIGSILRGIYKYTRNKADSFHDHSNISNYIKSNYIENNIERLKKRKIAIIDDDQDQYPIDHLRKRGFNVTSYTHVSLSDYEFIKNYDLIFLDITNVVIEDPQKGGFELIKRVRSEINGIVIIGVSSKRYDPTLTEFFKLADEQSKTPIDEKACEELILRVLNKHYSPTDIAKEIDSLLNDCDLSHRQHKKIIHCVTDYLSKSIDEDRLIKYVNKYSYKVDAYKLKEKSKKLKDLL